MGTVYRAMDHQLGRVALKAAPFTPISVTERLSREALASSRSSSRIVAVHDVRTLADRRST
jgi:hypothetical protein